MRVNGCAWCTTIQPHSNVENLLNSLPEKFEPLVFSSDALPEEQVTWNYTYKKVVTYAIRFERVAALAAAHEQKVRGESGSAKGREVWWESAYRVSVPKVEEEEEKWLQIFQAWGEKISSKTYEVWEEERECPLGWRIFDIDTYYRIDIPDSTYIQHANLICSFHMSSEIHQCRNMKQILKFKVWTGTNITLCYCRKSGMCLILSEIWYQWTSSFKLDMMCIFFSEEIREP